MPKYDSLRKTKRDQELLAYRKAHPDYSLQEIGDVFGLTRARVSQILKRYEGDNNQ